MSNARGILTAGLVALLALGGCAAKQKPRSEPTPPPAAPPPAAEPAPAAPTAPATEPTPAPPAPALPPPPPEAAGNTPAPAPAPAAPQEVGPPSWWISAPVRDGNRVTVAATEVGPTVQQARALAISKAESQIINALGRVPKATEATRVHMAQVAGGYRAYVLMVGE